MAISRVPGFSLLANLDRQGTDLSITSSGQTLQYWDVTNYRIGVNNQAPQQELDVSGNIITSNGHVLTNANLSYDIGSTTNWWRTVRAENIQSVNITGTLLTNAQPNITSIGTLSNLAISGNLTAPYFYGNLFGNVTGIILTNAQPYIDTLGTLSNLTVSGNITAPNFNGNVNGNITGTILTNAQPNINTLGTLTNLNVTGNILANNIISSTIIGTLLTNAQPNITSIGILANLSVAGNLSVDGNLIVGGVTVGNLSANNITANVFGNITGYVLQGDQPFITNLGDITVSNITITGGNLVIGGNVNFDNVYAGNLYQNGNRALDTSSNLQINGDVVGYGVYNNINVALPTTGVSAGTYGDDGIFPQFSVDDKGRISSAANIVLSQIGNLTFSNTTISSAADLTISTITNGNIYLNANGVGIVQFVGSDAIGIPSGNNATRPANPSIGYFRFNTDTVDIEYWNGTTWSTPAAGVISSDTINPDGSSNTFVLSSNSSTLGVIVSINGTLQQPTTAYTIVNNNQIQFTEIPLTTDIIEVRRIVPGTQTVSAESLTLGTTKVELDSANVNITGNILPSANVTYSLGSETLQWKDLWVSGNSIYIGGSELTVVNGQLSIGGNAVAAADPYGNINVAAYLGGSFSVGTITAGTWNGGTIGVAYGGTGATNANGALTNLLPSGASTGYVLTTGGSGSYYWASAGGGGGATVGQTINILRQSNTATQGQTVFTLTGNITYTPGAEQLGVYINGVRQFPTEYIETSSNVFTLTTGVNEGDVVFAEISKSQSFNNYANLTYASNVGNIAASGLTVQAAIESLENNKAPLNNPVFTSGTWNGGTIGVLYGGTGATTTSGVGGALDNLLPSGEQTGYVLSTSGAGTYSWVAPSAGGATVGQQLTTLRQANTIVSNTTVINLAGISYTPGAGQLRVYVNGVRQFPSAYTETSNVSYTLDANVVAGDSVFTEIDQFSSFNNFANLTFASNIGNIAAAGLTVQGAINSLETTKAPLVSPVFTGVTTVGGNLVVQGNLTAIGAAFTGNVTATNITINGLTTLAETTETLDTRSGLTGTVVHDFSTTAIWYYSNIAGNVTANITNVPTTNNRITSISIVINQGDTGFIVNGLQIDGAAQTIRWQGNTVPTASTNRLDVFTFSLLRATNAWTVLGSATSHG